MSAKQNQLDTYPFVVDRVKMTEMMASLGWRPANATDIPQMIDLGERLIGDRLISPETLSRFQALSGIAAWVFADPIEGLTISVPLSVSGLNALQNGTSIAASPEDEYIASIGQPCAAMYIGIYAGATHAARKAVMTGAGIIRMQLFAQVPCFARAATEDGARSMESLGWAPAGFGVDKLWMQGALIVPDQKVA